MAHAEHPLVATHGAHTASHLVGQGLEGETLIGGGQRAGDAVVTAVFALRLEEDVDRLLESALQQVFVALERDERER